MSVSLCECDQDAAQARFWSCEVGKKDFDAAFVLVSEGEPQPPMHLFFRYACFDGNQRSGRASSRNFSTESTGTKVRVLRG